MENAKKNCGKLWKTVLNARKCLTMVENDGKINGKAVQQTPQTAIPSPAGA